MIPKTLFFDFDTRQIDWQSEKRWNANFRGGDTAVGFSVFLLLFRDSVHNAYVNEACFHIGISWLNLSIFFPVFILSFIANKNILLKWGNKANHMKSFYKTQPVILPSKTYTPLMKGKNTKQTFTCASSTFTSRLASIFGNFVPYKNSSKKHNCMWWISLRWFCSLARRTSIKFREHDLNVTTARFSNEHDFFPFSSLSFFPRIFINTLNDCARYLK